MTLLFLSNCSQRHRQQPGAVKPKKFQQVALMLYENFDTALLHIAAAEVKAFYHCETVVLPSQLLPSSAWYPPNQRYRADSLIQFQKDHLPDGIESLIGITQKDISTTSGNKKDWGIFGLGYFPGRACVISVFRLRASTYDEYRERFIKVVLHELGHNQGLPHCSYNKYCVMNDAGGTIATVDRERKWLCPHCTQLLTN